MSDPTQHNWLEIGNVDDFPEGKKTERNLKKDAILILRQNEKWYAFEASCPHMSQPLHNAHVKDDELECEWHNMSFNLDTGKIIFDSGFIEIPNLKVYKIKVENGVVYVKNETN